MYVFYYFYLSIRPRSYFYSNLLYGILILLEFFSYAAMSGSSPDDRISLHPVTTITLSSVWKNAHGFVAHFQRILLKSRATYVYISYLWMKIMSLVFGYDTIKIVRICLILYNMGS